MNDTLLNMICEMKKKINMKKLCFPLTQTEEKPNI
jgi:hypothetical protein